MAGNLFGGRRRVRAVVVGAVVSAVFAVFFSVSGSVSRSAHAAAWVTFSSSSVDSVHCPDVALADAPAAPVSASGMRALARLARVEAAPQLAPTQTGMSDTGATSGVTMPAAQRDRLMSELRRAATASCRLRTVTAAESAGYYLASPYVDGVGTHWVNWAYVDRHFDPARPSMLLFKRSGGVTQLAGFSYWVRSTAAPEGFSGSADRWHRHSGLCFVAGHWTGEGLTRSACRGVWLNGRDLWMLHAWVVPDNGNLAGIFAPLSRRLCRPHTPDIAACPRTSRGSPDN